MNTVRAVRIIIHGRVQGVSFREYARRKALALGLCGYVRNLSDGSVEAVASGAAAKIEEFLAFCRRGSPVSRVQTVDVLPFEGEATLPPVFEIRR